MLRLLTALGLIYTITSAHGQTYHFVDVDTDVTHATVTFENGKGGKLRLLPRWCSSDSRNCEVGEHDPPSNYARFFAERDEIQKPIDIKLEDKVSITLNPVFGTHADLEKSDVQRGKFRRSFMLRQSDDTRALQLPEKDHARTVELKSDDPTMDPMRVFFPKGSSDGFGAVLAFPTGWCGRPTAFCSAFTYEVGSDVLKKWVDGQFAADEPFAVYDENIELSLFGGSDSLTLKLVQPSDNGKALEQTFVMGQRIVAPTLQICENRPEASVGGFNFKITRKIDNACIGSVGWANVPAPKATMRLLDRWCGQKTCGAVTLQSDVFRSGDKPNRFVATDNAASLVTIASGKNGWLENVALMGRDGRAIVKIGITRQKEQPAKRSFKISELKQPLGIYSLVPNRTTLDSVGHIGENLCQISPRVFTGSGKIWFKGIQAPVNGNPYVIRSWLDCARWEGEANASCTMHEGSPDAPNPVGVSKGYDFTAIGGGHFKACLRGGSENCALLYSCIRPDSKITVTRKFPSGGSMIGAILAGPNGGTSRLRYLDNTTIAIED